MEWLLLHLGAVADDAESPYRLSPSETSQKACRIIIVFDYPTLNKDVYQQIRRMFTFKMTVSRQLHKNQLAILLLQKKPWFLSNYFWV